MTQETPNALHLESAEKKASVIGMPKWPLYVGLLVGFLMFCVLFYSINYARSPEEALLESQKVVINEEEKPLLTGEGSGLAIEAPENTAIIVKEEEKKPAEPLIVLRDAPPEKRVNPEEENLRRLRTQALLSALSAPLAVKKTSHEQVNTEQSVNNERRNTANSVHPDAFAGVAQGYNPAADKDKENFLASRAQGKKQWTLEHERTAGHALEIKTGAVIPGVMLTGINSELPGQIIAQVSQNVFDTASGRHLLIPQGAKLFGVYDSRIVYGQSRVLVAWNRIVYPDGSSLSLGAMAGSDISGYGGYKDEVDNHYWRTFGSALLMSLIVGGTAYATDSMGGGDEYSLQGQMTAAMAQQLGQATTNVLQKNLNIKPTLEIRPGYVFNIVVSKDIVFRAPYTEVKG